MGISCFICLLFSVSVLAGFTPGVVAQNAAIGVVQHSAVLTHPPKYSQYWAQMISIIKVF